jgi:hypothetical protein
MRPVHRLLGSARVRETLWVGAASLVLLYWMVLRTYLMWPDHPDFDHAWDHKKYLYMAEHGVGSLQIAPFGWRVGVPLLASLFPFSIEISFALLSLSCIWLTGIAIYYLVKRISDSRIQGFIGLILFYSIGWVVKFTIYDFWLPDAFLFLLLVVGLDLALRGRTIALGVLLLFGATVKESILILVPLYYTLGAKRAIDVRLLARTALVAAPAVGMTMLLRFSIEAQNDVASYVATLPANFLNDGDRLPYRPLALLQTIGLDRIRQFSWKSFLQMTTASYGIAPLVLPFFAPREALRLLARWWPLLLFAYAQIFVAYNVERLVVLAFPLLILMSTSALASIASRIGCGPRTVVVVPTALFLTVLAQPKAHFAPDFEVQSLALLLSLGACFWARRVGDLEESSSSR